MTDPPTNAEAVWSGRERAAGGRASHSRRPFLKALAPKQLKAFSAQLRRYSGFLRGLWSDAFVRYKGTVIAVVVAGTFGVLLQVKAIALVLFYANLFKDGETLDLFGRRFIVRESIVLLAAFATICLIVLLISAALSYFARSRLFLLWRDYAEYCSQRVLAILAAAPRSAPLGPECLNDSSILMIARTEALYCGRVFSLVAGSVAPLLSFLTAIAVLFWLSPLLTAGLVILMGGAGIFLYRVNVRGAGHSVRMEQYAKGASREYRRILQDQKSSLSARASATVAQEQDFADGNIRRYTDAYVGRLLVLAESELVSNVFMSLAVFALLIMLGWSIMARGQGWEHMAVYVVALHYSLMMFRTVSGKITAINRFYPQVRRYLDFIERSGNPATDHPEPRARYRLGTEDAAISGSARTSLIEPGCRLALVSTLPLDRFTLTYTMGSLLGHEPAQLRAAVASMAFVPSTFQGWDVPLREALACPGGCTWSHIRDWARSAGLADELEEHMPHGLDQQFSQEQWRGLRAALRFFLALVPAMHEAQWVVLEAAGFSLLPAECRRLVLERLSDRLVVMHYTDEIERVGGHGEHVVAVHDGHHVIGLGDVEWLRCHGTQVQELLTAATNAEAGTAKDDEADLDEGG